MEYYDFAVYNETTKRWGTGWMLEFVGFEESSGADVLRKLAARCGFVSLYKE